jgi:quinolinate synthase
LGDYRGDSFDLSQMAAANWEARFIAFCGVHYMEESAAILAQPHQTVQITDLEAGCLMTDMVDPDQVEMAWAELTESLVKCTDNAEICQRAETCPNRLI